MSNAKKLTFLLFLTTVCAFGFQFEVAAQRQKKDTPDEAAIKKVINGFATAYANVTETKDKDSVLRFVTPELHSTNILASVNERITSEGGNYELFESYLNSMIRVDGLKIDYKVTDIPIVNVRGNIASAVYLVAYQIKRDGDLWSEGNEVVTLTLLRPGPEHDWKIRHFTFVNIEDAKHKGVCLCELFVANTGNYVAKTTVPSGKGYETSLNNFEFAKRNDMGDFNIKFQDKIYQWASNGEVSDGVDISARDASPTKVLGKATEKGEAVLLIVQRDLFVENCTNFRVRRR